MRSRPRIRPATVFRNGIGMTWTAILARALSVIALGLTVFAATVSAHAEDTIKIAYTDPMSGPFAQVGQQTLQQMQYVLTDINAKGGALGRKFELVVFD
ncbi:MAG: ABC transporter substrate-binding protein, partial [Acetobacteraceae bacterium]|nr:ABC transporter substrate-binding protein [Acetobacteraceae bacterium]